MCSSGASASCSVLLLLLKLGTLSIVSEKPTDRQRKHVIIPSLKGKN